MSGATFLFWLLATVALTGAAFAVLSSEVMRTALGLGAMLLALAGFFAFYGYGFLALAELFVYVGGVLVLVLFAVMLVHRSGAGGPALTSRHDAVVASAVAGIGGLLTLMLRGATASFGPPSGSGASGELSTLLLGRLLPHFELVGAMLLAALVAVVLLMAGDRE